MRGVFDFRYGLQGAIVAGAGALICACATLPAVNRVVPSYALADARSTVLGASHAGSGTDSTLDLIESGAEALAARIALADAAQRTLDLQYYLALPDASTARLLGHVVAAADRGVRVRVLFDHFHGRGRETELAALARHPNIQVRVFNPFAFRALGDLSRLVEYLLDAPRLKRRMHNKLWIADNAVAVIGGRNLGDAYFGGSPDVTFFDLDLMAAGKVVRELSDGFDAYWNSPLAVPVDALVESSPLAAPALGAAALSTDGPQALLSSLGSEHLSPALRRIRDPLPVRPAAAHAIYDPPAQDRARQPARIGGVGLTIRDALDAAKKEIIIITPYFVPERDTVRHLCRSARRGVRVAVLTNSLAATDVPVAHLGYARVRPVLLACGVALYEFRPDAADHDGPPATQTSLHAKAVVIDGLRVLVGSMNLDMRSLRWDTQVGVLADSPTLAGRLRTLFDRWTHPSRALRVLSVRPERTRSPLVWIGAEQGRSVRYDREPFASRWRQAGAELVGLFVPIDML